MELDELLILAERLEHELHSAVDEAQIKISEGMKGRWLERKEARALRSKLNRLRAVCRKIKVPL